MMREIERIFETLKDDFNHKISTFGYFTTFNDILDSSIITDGGSITDSYEDISLDKEDENDDDDDNEHGLFTPEVDLLSCKSIYSEEGTVPIPVVDNAEFVNTHEISNLTILENDQVILDKIEIVEECHEKDIDEVSDMVEQKLDEITDLDPPNLIQSEMDLCNGNEESTKIEIIISENKSIEIAEEDNESRQSSEKEQICEIGEIECVSEISEREILDIKEESQDNDTSEEKEPTELIEQENRECEMLEAHDRKFIENKPFSELISPEPDSDQVVPIFIDQTYKNFPKTDSEIIQPTILTEKPLPFEEIKIISDARQIKKNIGTVKFCENENVNIKPIETPKQSYQNQQHRTTDHRKMPNERSLTKRPLKNSINRKMWSEMSEVIESGILSNFDKKEIQLQEAMFEIITSEASYFQSLMVLTTHFFQSELFTISEDKENLVSPLDKHHIFSNIILILKTSQSLLKDLEHRWHEEKPKLADICDVVLNHVRSENFQNYVTYLRNQQYQTQALKRLSENENFKQQLHKLETSPICGKLALDSYLMLPMQRLTRLKLLVEAVSKIQNCEEMKHMIKLATKKDALDALEEIKKLLNTSNNEKGLMDQKGALLCLINKIDFPPNCKRITFSDRILLREDELLLDIQTPFKTTKKITKKKQASITLLLFNDLLIITKKKGGRLLVLDYCEKRNIEVKAQTFNDDHLSNDLSSNTSFVDISSSSLLQSPIKSLGSTLIRSKTSLTSDEKKRLSIPINHSFTSMPSISKFDDQEKKETFSLQLLKGHTGLLDNNTLYLTARNREERDIWLSLFNSNQSPSEGCTMKNIPNPPKLQKSVSLKAKPSYIDCMKSKPTYSFKNSQEDITVELLAQTEIAQDWKDDFLLNKFSFEVKFEN